MNLVLRTPTRPPPQNGQGSVVFTGGHRALGLKQLVDSLECVVLGTVVNERARRKGAELRSQLDLDGGEFSNGDRVIINIKDLPCPHWLKGSHVNRV